MTNSIKDKSQNDVVMKEFWRDNKHFADIVNAVVFDGEQVVIPDELQEVDTDVSGSIIVDEYKETLKRIRDVVKKYYYGVEFNIIGLEVQENVHLAMPLRTLVYDALGYLKEYNKISSVNEKHGYKCKERTEFLSRLKRTDKFHPIITIVFYYGEKCWDGPVNLKDMMVDMPGKIAEKFNDYRLNLIQIRDSYKYRFNNDDVRLLFDFVSDLYNKEFDKIFKEYKGRDVSIEFIEMIGRITGTKELVKLADNGRKDKVVNMEMCNAMKEFLEGGRREGQREGRIEGQREGRIEGQREGRIEGKDEARLDSIRTLMKKLDQTAEEDMDTLDIADEDKVRYRKMLGL